MAGTKGFNFAPSASALLLGFVGKGCYVTNLSSVVHALTSGVKSPSGVKDAAS